MLLSAIKARSNPLLGLWWRYQVFVGEPGSPRALTLLLGMFIAVRLAAIIADAHGAPGVSASFTYLWLAFCIYTWVAPSLFQKQIDKELEPVTLRKGF